MARLFTHAILMFSYFLLFISPLCATAIPRPAERWGINPKCDKPQVRNDKMCFCFFVLSRKLKIKNQDRYDGLCEEAFHIAATFHKGNQCMSSGRYMNKCQVRAEKVVRTINRLIKMCSPEAPTVALMWDNRFVLSMNLEILLCKAGWTARIELVDCSLRQH